MKLAKLAASALGLSLLAGCGNFVTDFGIPTVTLALRKSTIETTNIGTVDKPINVQTRKVVINAFTEPGSPAGLMLNITLTDGNTVPSGIRLSACPNNGVPIPTPEQGDNTAPPTLAPDQVACPAARLEFSYEIPASGDTARAINSYVLQSLNQQKRTITLGAPLPIN